MGEEEGIQIPYVLSAHGGSDHPSCLGTVDIPDNIILQYFSNPILKDTQICLNSGDEAHICSRYGEKKEYQYTSESPIKPPNLFLYRLDDNQTNTGLFNCNLESWEPAAGLGPVEPTANREITVSYLTCLSDVLHQFSIQFREKYPEAKALLYIAVCLTGASIENKTKVYIYHPAKSKRQTLANYEAEVEAEEREAEALEKLKQKVVNAYMLLLMWSEYKARIRINSMTLKSLYQVAEQINSSPHIQEALNKARRKLNNNKSRKSAYKPSFRKSRKHRK